MYLCYLMKWMCQSFSFDLDWHEHLRPGRAPRPAAVISTRPTGGRARPLPGGGVGGGGGECRREAETVGERWVDAVMPTSRLLKATEPSLSICVSPLTPLLYFHEEQTSFITGKYFFKMEASTFYGFILWGESHCSYYIWFGHFHCVCSGT